jgi:hypothetical protein
MGLVWQWSLQIALLTPQPVFFCPSLESRAPFTYRGYVDTFDIIIAILALEKMALKKFGAQFYLGKDLVADQEILLAAY